MGYRVLIRSESAVAVPDSLEGLAILSYNEATSGLFILQVHTTDAGTYACGHVAVRGEAGSERDPGEVLLTVPDGCRHSP